MEKDWRIVRGEEWIVPFRDVSLVNATVTVSKWVPVSKEEFQGQEATRGDFE